MLNVELKMENKVDDDMSTVLIAAGAALEALGGSYSRALEGATHEKREKIKRAATNVRLEVSHPSTSGLAYVAHAYAHWARVVEDLLRGMPADDFDELFPEGISFRRYLCHWLHAVGVPKLGATSEHLLVIHEMTGAAPIPHPWLPVGYSMFIFELRPQS